MPFGLLSTYEQYKRDTDIVASWLATTAASSGYSKPLSQPPANAVPSASSSQTQRLKGKARKGAKKQPGLELASPTEGAKPRHVVAIKDFLPLAQFVSGNLSDSIGVPGFFAQALNRVIETRKRFSTLLGGVRRFQDYRGDKKHAFFVTVLERVRDVLKSRVDAFDASAMKDATRSIGDDGTTGSKDGAGPKNMFAVLDVYEPSGGFLVAPDVDRQAAAPTEYVAEDDDSETEALFVYTAFLRDLDGLRKEILKLWGEYKSGERDLSAASVATNTAMQLARNMERDIAPSIEKLGGPLGAILMFFEAACAARGQSPAAKELRDDDFNYRCYEEGSDLYYNTYVLLNSFKTTDISKDLPTYNGKFGWYDDTNQAGSNRGQWQQDKAALFEVFADQVLLCQLLKRVEVHDEFTKGLNAMLQTGEVHVWLCFSAQVYLDILKFLGPHVRNAERDLQRLAKPIAESIEKAFRAGVNRELTLKQTMQDLYKLAIIWGSGKDPFSAVRIASGLQERASNFLEHHPTYCGLHLHYVRALFHRVGIEYAAKPGNVMDGVQLYQALRQEGLVQAGDKWDALESVLASQGNATFFVGDPPKSPEAYYKNFGLSKGISAAQWVQQRKAKNKRVATSKAGICCMKLKGVCSLSFAERILTTSDPRGLNAEVVDQILERSGWLKKTEGSEPPGTLEQSSALGKDRNGRQTKSHRVLGPAELVYQTCLAIHNELPDILLDYYQIDRTCCTILRRVREAVDSSTGGGSIDSSQVRTIGDDDLGDVVGFVFAAAVGQVPVSSSDSMAPFREAAAVFKDMSATEGQ